jgi:hypothetical protein
MSTVEDIISTINSVYDNAGLSEYKDIYDYFDTGEEFGTHLFREGIDNFEYKDEETFTRSIKAKPYSTPKFYNTSVTTQIPIASVRIVRYTPEFYFDIESRKKTLNEFLAGYGLVPGSTHFEMVPSLESMYRIIKERINTIIDHLESYDLKIKGVLEVFQIEIFKRIRESGLTYPERLQAYLSLFDNIDYIYTGLCRHTAPKEPNVEKWLLNEMNETYLHFKLVKATANGIAYYMDKKDPFIDTLSELYKKLLFLEWTLNKIIDGTPVETSYSVNISGDTTQETAIEKANDRIRKTRDKELLTKFFRNYIIFEAGGGTIEKIINNILIAVPELEEYNNGEFRTFRNWIDYYEEAYKLEIKKLKQKKQN